ncbi:MAG TPA: hypothetical protein VN841_16775 [Bryobacteraceae bacterium]|nr:hypothetical protein [Bryobacteraceae bacterium]
MHPEVFQKVVWEEMLYAQMRSNYFAELVHHYMNRDKGLRVLALLASSGVVVTILAQTNTELLRFGVPIFAAAISFWLLLSQYTSMARDASELHAGWSAVAHDYEGVWNNLYAADAQARYQQIYDRAEALSRSGAKFPNKADRLSYWLDQATTISMARYAH